MKRAHPMINNFNPYIISACRSNMDIKYIFSGKDAKALVYYITDYVTKSNLSFYDTFSLVYKGMNTFERYNTNAFAATESPEERTRRMVLRCYNSIATKQQLPGVMIASYLLGFGDKYSTHTFANIFLIGFERFLQNNLDSLKEELKSGEISNAAVGIC